MYMNFLTLNIYLVCLKTQFTIEALVDMNNSPFVDYMFIKIHGPHNGPALTCTIVMSFIIWMLSSLVPNNFINL